jgi:hypothetical protein
MPPELLPRCALSPLGADGGRGAWQRKHADARAKHGNAWHSMHSQSPGRPFALLAPPPPPSRRPARPSRSPRSSRRPPPPPPTLPPADCLAGPSRRAAVCRSSRLASCLTSRSRSSKRASSPRAPPPSRPRCIASPGRPGLFCEEWWDSSRRRASAMRTRTRACPLARRARLCQAGSPRGLVARRG